MRTQPRSLRGLPAPRRPSPSSSRRGSKHILSAKSPAKVQVVEGVVVLVEVIRVEVVKVSVVKVNSRMLSVTPG